MSENKNNITVQSFEISLNTRKKILNQEPKLIWFTGLSGSGKSTLSNELEKKLFNNGYFTYALDGDNTRVGLCKDLGFSSKDRSENIRRIAEVSKILVDAGLIVLASFISPFNKDRELIKSIVGVNNFIEIFVSTPIEECEKRDIKGLYKKARLGQIKNFTGITSPFEKPINPDLEINTTNMEIEEASKILFEYINKILNGKL